MRNWKYFDIREDWKQARWGYLGFTVSFLFGLLNPSVGKTTKYWIGMACAYVGMTVLFFVVLGPLSRYLVWRRRMKEFEDANRRAMERATFGAGKNPP